MQLKSVFFIVLTLVLMGCSASQFNLREGIKSFKTQNYRQAFIRLKPEADRGQPDAQYAIGYMYYYGQGVVEDRNRAMLLINEAAKAGQPDAITALKILHGASY